MKNLIFLTLSCLTFSNVYASTNKYKIDDRKIEKLFAQASEISFVSADTTKRCEESALLGIANASMYKTDIWFIGGLGAGCLTGGCTIGVVPVFALTSNTQPLFYPKNIDRFCYRMAYDKELTKKRARSALWGGVAGGIVFYTAYIALIFLSIGLP